MKNRFWLTVTFLLAICAPSRIIAVGPYFVTDLGTLPNGATTVDANDINSRGQAVGQNYRGPSPIFHGFLWSPSTPNGISGSMIQLPPPATAGSAINDYGQVAAFNAFASGVSLWTPETARPTRLPANPGARTLRADVQHDWRAFSVDFSTISDLSSKWCVSYNSTHPTRSTHRTCYREPIDALMSADFPAANLRGSRGVSLAPAAGLLGWGELPTTTASGPGRPPPAFPSCRSSGLSFVPVRFRSSG
jgi:hypothetical protein